MRVSGIVGIDDSPSLFHTLQSVILHVDVDTALIRLACLPAAVQIPRDDDDDDNGDGDDDNLKRLLRSQKPDNCPNQGEGQTIQYSKVG